MNRWAASAPSTLASSVSLVKGFSEFLWERGYATEHVAFRMKRPRRLRAEDLDVVTVTTEDVTRILDCCETWQEFLLRLDGDLPRGTSEGAGARPAP